MDFGLFTMFSIREGVTQFHTFQEWFDLMQVAEDMGLDTVWLGESHFRPQRAVLASPLVGPVPSRPAPSASALAWQYRCCCWQTRSALLKKPPLSITSAPAEGNPALQVTYCTS